MFKFGTKTQVLFLCLIFLMIALQGCSGKIDRDRISKGEEMCQNNGGLDTITFDVHIITDNIVVHCKDGLHAKIPRTEEVK